MLKRFDSRPLAISTNYCHFSELDSYEDRVSEVQRLVDAHIPAANKKMLELLLCHLENVALKSGINMMTISNLGRYSVLS